MAADWLNHLVEDGTISADQLAEAEDMAANLGIKPEDALIKQGYVASSVIGRALAEAYGYDYLELEEQEILPSVIEMVPESVARENIVIPLRSKTRPWSSPSATRWLSTFSTSCGSFSTATFGSPSPPRIIQTAINRHYGQTETESVDSMLQEFTETAIDFTETEMQQAVDARRTRTPRSSSW